MSAPDRPSRAVSIATGVLLAPLVILHVGAAFFLYLGVTIRPDGPGDHSANSATALSRLITMVASTSAMGYHALVVGFARMRGLWLLPAQLLAILAVLRWLTHN